MIITADARRRVTLPKPARPGDAFDLEATGPGQFLLTRLEKPARKVTLCRGNGFLVATSGRRITMAGANEICVLRSPSKPDNFVTSLLCCSTNPQSEFSMGNGG